LLSFATKTCNLSVRSQVSPNFITHLEFRKLWVLPESNRIIKLCSPILPWILVVRPPKFTPVIACNEISGSLYASNSWSYSSSSITSPIPSSSKW
jgi:hypothetical protein